MILTIMKLYLKSSTQKLHMAVSYSLMTGFDINALLPIGSLPFNVNHYEEAEGRLSVMDNRVQRKS